ncbi:MAG: DUF6600 domain-containing protein [Lautropia sp.]
MIRQALVAACALLAMTGGAAPLAAQAGGGKPAPYAPPPAPATGDVAEPDPERELSGAGARIGRVSLLEGESWWFVEAMSQAGWLPAEPNLPLLSRSSLSTGREARAEVRLGSTTVAIDRDSQADFMALSGAELRLRVVRGSVAITIDSIQPDEVVELLAGEARLRISAAGTYILVDDRISGRLLAKVQRGRAYLSIGADSTSVTGGMQAVIEAGANRIAWHGSVSVGEFEQWASARATQWQGADPPAQVSAEMTGADVLDANGHWENHQAHGRMWYPAGVDAAWEPYRDGRWTEIQPWGIVWVAAAPWGFATSWYGRWQRTDNRWGWIPGARTGRPVFHPPAAFAPPPPQGPGVGPVRWPDTGRGVAPVRQPSQPAALPPRFAPAPSGGFALPPRDFPQPSRDVANPPRDFPTPSRDWPSPAGRGLGPPASLLPGQLPSTSRMVIKPQGDPAGGWKRATQ